MNSDSLLHGAIAGLEWLHPCALGFKADREIDCAIQSQQKSTFYGIVVCRYVNLSVRY